MKDLNSVADLHNRGKNFQVAVNHAKSMNIPFLFWEEDTLFIRLSDLPRVASNMNPNWRVQTPLRVFLADSDDALRFEARAGYGYDIVGVTRQGQAFTVREWLIRSR